MLTWDLFKTLHDLNSGIEVNAQHAFVTVVPAKKNTINKVNGMFDGWTAWATAVTRAATIPAGVRDLCDQAL